MSQRAYLGLGSNLKTPKRQIHLAIQKIKKLPKTYLKAQSERIITRPLSQQYQPRYCNTVVSIETTLPPLKLLRYCLTLEKKQGRVRKKRWSSRTLDIDLLCYAKCTMHHPKLILPHPQIPNRSFVIEPLQKLIEA